MMQPGTVYGAALAAKKFAIGTFHIDLANAIQGMILESEVHPEMGTPPMLVAPPLLTPTPVTGIGMPVLVTPAEVLGAEFALASKAPPTTSFYLDAMALAAQVLTESTVPSLGLVAAPGGVIDGVAVIVAAQPADAYGIAFAAKSACPPTSSQATFYTDVAQLVLDMLKDAIVSGTGLLTTAGGGPVTGTAKIT